MGFEIITKTYNSKSHISKRGIAQICSPPVQGTEAAGAVPEQPRDSEGGEGGGGGAAAQGYADGQVARGDQGPRARGRDRGAGMQGDKRRLCRIDHFRNIHERDPNPFIFHSSVKLIP